LFHGLPLQNQIIIIEYKVKKPNKKIKMRMKKKFERPNKKMNENGKKKKKKKLEVVHCVPTPSYLM